MSSKIGLCIAYKENHTNYGTSLLAFATQKIISDLGYDNEVIIYKKKRDYLDLFLKAPLLMLSGGYQTLKNSRKFKKSMSVHPHYAKGIRERVDSVNKYKEKYVIPNAKEYHGFEELKKGSSNYSLVMVGSDQVWLPLGLYSKFFNLLFVEDHVPKLAYSSSFGVSHIPWWQRKQTKYYLERFDAIAVREIRGKEIVEDLSNQTAQVVMDPTLLVSKEDWKEHVRDCKIITEEDYIFCYFLGTNMEARNAVNKLKQKTGLKVIFCPHMDEYIEDDESFGDISPYNLSPADFVNYIINAKYVCTDSFHCTIFSIHFEKQFLTFYRFDSESKNSRNSRIDSLFSLLNLKERLYNEGVDNQIDLEIDYKTIHKKLEVLVSESRKFLIDNLKKLVV